MRPKGFIPREFIDRLVAQADIVNIINMRVPLKKAGSNYKACCPFHDEKTPSFNVNEPKQFYYCFGCGVGGSVIDFIMAYERLDFIEAIEVIARHEGLEIPYERRGNYNPKEADRIERLQMALAQASAFYQQNLHRGEEGQKALEYLTKRGIIASDIERYGIGYASDSWDGVKRHLANLGYSDEEMVDVGLLSQSDYNKYDRFRGRVIFPIRNRRGDTIGFGGRILGEGEPKYLNSPETPLFKKGHELYGLYELRKYMRNYSEVIVVEGYMDVVMLAHYGFGNSVATLGTAISKIQIERLFRYTSKIIFCFDGDRAGRDAANKALYESLSAIPSGKELAFLFLPEGEDPDSFIQSEGADAFRKAIDGSTPFSDYLFEMLEQEIDSSTMEGRSQLLSRAAELINQMRDTPLRDLLRQDLAERAMVSEAILNRHVQPGVIDRPQRRAIQHHNHSIVARIIILLLNNFELAKELNGISFLLESNDREQNILYQILILLKEHPDLKNIPQLLLHFEGEPWLRWLEHLAVQEAFFEEEELQIIEIKDLFNRLLEEEDPIKRILGKMRNGEPLTEMEKALLRLQHSNQQQ